MSEFVCAFCKKEFKFEKASLKHVCEKKRRYFEKDTKAALLAFHAFSRMYRINYRVDVTYEKFMNSSLYTDFLKLGKYILDIDAIAPKDYIEYLLKESIPAAKWCHDSEYLKYVKALTMKETPHRALERTVILMQEWSIKNGQPWQSFFENVATPLAVQWIIAGRISPWVLLNCDSGKEMINKLSDEQMLLVGPSLNIKLWMGKFGRHQDAVRDIQEALRDEGL